MSYRIAHDFHAVHHSGHRLLGEIRVIVIHDMESTNKSGAAEGAGAWFENLKSGGSAHYGVDNAGPIQRYLDLDVIAWGAPHLNATGVHIEQMGKASWSREEWLKNAAVTIDKCAWLVARLHRRLGIPIRRLTDNQLRAGARGVVPHSQGTRVFGGTHTDPGPGYPMGHMLDLARKYADA